MLQENNEMMEQKGEELNSMLETLQNRDQLTELATHQAFLRRLEHEVTVARQSGRNFSALLIDIDGFTELNLQHGFEVGDEFLRRVSNILQRQLKDAALVARVGPDSFGVILGGDERAGRLAAERVRAGVEVIRLDIGRQRVRISCKVTGVALSDIPETAGYQHLNAELYRLRAANLGANRTYWKESYWRDSTWQEGT